jgi:E3 SUMO-protein ligase PIAS1
LGRYFDEILKQSPESVEDVIVEADGEWHTSDNKYGSSTWKSTHPVASASTLTPSRSSSSILQAPINSPPKPVNGHTNDKAKAKANDDEIFVLDSDDEDEGQVKRELSPSFGSGSSVNHSFSVSATSVRQTQSQISDVIDLTLDSEEEEPPLSKQTGKRKATDADLSSTSPTEPIWKKSRVEADRLVPPGLSRGASSNANAVDYHAIHQTTSRSTPHSSPLQYYPGGTTAPNYSIYGGSPTGSSPGTSLPGINSILPRTSSRWT